MLKHFNRKLFTLNLQQLFEAPRLKSAPEISNLMFIDLERSRTLLLDL